MRVDARRSDPVVSARTRRLLLLALVVLVVASVHRLWLAPPPLRVHEIEGRTMGTTYSVLVAAVLDAEDGARAVRAIEDELERTSALMSSWIEESELSRFNRLGSDAPFAASPETLEVFRIARAVSERSGGAFDVTVGPLVRAWGFGPGDASVPLSAPGPGELARLRERVGWRNIEIGESTLRKREPRLEADLSAVAKGWGVDRVSAALTGLGLTDHLVEIGGEIRARGSKPGGAPWRIAIERPDPGTRDALEIVELRDVAMATSGDYRNYYELDGERISHTIDPRTGRPVRHRLASVTVVHESAAWADAWATALDVLGPDAGPALARAEGLTALFVVRDGEAFRSQATGGFDSLRAELD